MSDSSTVAAAYEHASAHWSSLDRGSTQAVRVGFDEFASYIADLGIAPERIEQRSIDLFLVAALSANDRGAAHFFDAHVIARAGSAVRRYGDDDFTSEVLQRLRVQLLVTEGEEPPRICRYDGRASLQSWVGVCAVRMALYTLRGERNQRSIGVQWSESIAALPSGDPALDELKSRYADAFRGALERAATLLDKRQRAVLRLRFAHNASVDDIAATYSVHRVTAWRWLSGARDALLERALGELRRAIPGDETTLGSLAGLIQSRIDLSVLGLFADDGDALEPPV